MREVSIDNAELIRKTIVNESYKLDEETMVTFSMSPKPLDAIELERKNARTCLELGVPALFSFETVSCGDKIGVIYENFHAKTLGQQIMSDPEHFDHYMDLYASALKRMHEIHVPAGKLPFIETEYKNSLNKMHQYLSDEEINKALKLVDAVPDTDTFLAMGFNPGFALYQDDQLYMNQFSYTSYGNPLFELADLCESIQFVAKGATKDKFLHFLTNMDRETTAKVWPALLQRYFNFNSEEEFKAMDGFINAFALLKLSMTAVDVPNLHQEMIEGTVRDCRERFFPYIDVLTEKVQHMKF